MSNHFIKATIIRAIRTVCQTLASMLPVGFVFTPELIRSADCSVVYVILAWLFTGLLAGVASVLTSIATGLPEVEYAEHIYMSHDEPDDAEVTGDED
jgi:hypothetical protein